MQIRELNLKELQIAYDIVSQFHTLLTYNEFEDLIYDMRYMDYKMIGIFEADTLVTYAGVAIQTNLYHKRHLLIFELITDKKYIDKGYQSMMSEYLIDYAKMGMCESVVSFSK